MLTNEMHTERLTPFHLQVHLSDRQRADCAKQHVFNQPHSALAQLALGEIIIGEERAFNRIEDSNSILVDILCRGVVNFFSDGVQNAQYNIEETD